MLMVHKSLQTGHFECLTYELLRIDGLPRPATGYGSSMHPEETFCNHRLSTVRDCCLPSGLAERDRLCMQRRHLSVFLRISAASVLLLALWPQFAWTESKRAAMLPSKATLQGKLIVGYQGWLQTVGDCSFEDRRCLHPIDPSTGWAM